MSKRCTTTVLALSAAAFLAACGGDDGTETADGGNGMMPEDLPDRDTIYRTSTVADLEALGARKLDEKAFMSEIVGKRLRSTGGVNSGATPEGQGWLWTFRPDGITHSRSAKGRLESDGGWESNLEWKFIDGQQCQRGIGSSDEYGCRTVYELNGVYRWADHDDPDNLTGWSVEEADWDVGALLYDGETLTARHVAAARLNHQGGKTELIDPVGFSIRRTEEGNYVVMFDGFEHTFTPDQRDETGATGPNDALDIKFSVYGWTRRDFNKNLDAGHSRGEHVMYMKADRDHEEIQGTDPGLTAFVMFGNPTSDFSRLNDITATYSGSEGGAWSMIHVYSSSFDPGNFDWERGQDRDSLYSTDLEFTANFSRNTISGRIDNFRVWENGDDSDEPYGLTLTMPETEFGTEGFSGTFDVSGQSVQQGTANYDASFWGPDASDVAGTMTITGTDIDKDMPFVGVGHFQAKR